MSRFNSVIGIALLVTAGVGLAAQTQPAAPQSSVSAGVQAGRSAGPTGRVPTTIRGSVFDSVNAPMSKMTVRLRDARFGRIVDTQVTDTIGAFAFTPSDPGSYIVEVMSGDRTVLAASDIIDVNAGDAATTIVKLPLHAAPHAGGLGGRTASAVAIAAAAVGAGVLATTATGNEVSQRKAF
jgi:hypothetical protein